MKKIGLIFALIIAISSCSGKGNAASDSATVAEDTTSTDSAITVTGIALDGAMNSILIKTQDGDSLSLGYPQLPTDKRYSWMIGDTVAITYIPSTDSVLSLQKGYLK